MEIQVIGAGYVGLSNALLLARKHKVTLTDIDLRKIENLISGIPPFEDSLVKRYLQDYKKNITFNSCLHDNFFKSDVILIAVPTDFIASKKSFNTTAIENILSTLNIEKFSNLIVIRSTVPSGFIDKMQKRFPNLKISFFPEFLREGSALRDNLYPSRIICGGKFVSAINFLKTLEDCAIKSNIPSLITTPSEAEAIKLFSNSYLAMRIAFFNELDSFTILKNLDTKSVIQGVSMDPRIGNDYNNPSFGYGGYCLPKDISQLKSDFGNFKQKLFDGIILSNKARKENILKEIISKGLRRHGIYRLSMKKGSSNWKESAIIDVLKGLKKMGSEIKIYEPEFPSNSFMHISIERNLNDFLEWSEIIIANREDDITKANPEKIFTRDIFNKN